jgi:hypothetical protein
LAGKGPTGQLAPLAIPTVIPTQNEKCPKSPGKRKYYNLIDAEKAAASSAAQYRKPMSAYVCDGCGLYHVTGKVQYGDVTASRSDGVIVTAGMSTRTGWKKDTLAPNPPERADMSEVIAMESPIIAGNTAAREKLIGEFLQGRESVTMPEVMDYAQCSHYQATQAMRMLGWTGTRGQASWLPPGVERPAPVRTGKAGKSSRGKPSAVQLRRSRIKKLKQYLADKDAVTTAEVQVHLECGKDMAKALLKEAGWNAGWGANAKWTPGEDKLAHRRRIVPTPEQIEQSVQSNVTEKEPAVQEPIDLAAHRHPAGNGRPDDYGWRPVPSLEALQMKQVNTIIEELSVYGLEMRIEIREKRG